MFVFLDTPFDETFPVYTRANAGAHRSAHWRGR